MATYRKLGDTLDLEIQLGKGDSLPTTRVFARIEELDGTVLTAEFELTKINDGSYTDDTKTMPSNDAIKVLYFIRKADGVTIESRFNPNFVSELFLRDFTAELIATNLDAKISTGRVSEIIGATLEDVGLEGGLEEEILIGEVEEDTIITGVVDEC